MNLFGDLKAPFGERRMEVAEERCMKGLGLWGGADSVEKMEPNRRKEANHQCRLRQPKVTR